MLYPLRNKLREEIVRTDPVILEKAYELSKVKKTTSEVMDMKMISSMPP